MDTLWPFHHDRKDPEPGRPRPRGTSSEISCVPSGGHRKEDNSWTTLNPFSFISSATTPESHHQSSEGTSGLFFVPYLFGTKPYEKKNTDVPLNYSSSSRSRSNEETTLPHPSSSVELSSHSSYQDVRKAEEQPSSFAWMSYPFTSEGSSGPTHSIPSIHHHPPSSVSFLCSIRRFSCGFIILFLTTYSFSSSTTPSILSMP